MKRKQVQEKCVRIFNFFYCSKCAKRLRFCIHMGMTLWQPQVPGFYRTEALAHVARCSLACALRQQTSKGLESGAQPRRCPGAWDRRTNITFPVLSREHGSSVPRSSVPCGPKGVLTMFCLIFSAQHKSAVTFLDGGSFMSRWCDC